MSYEFTRLEQYEIDYLLSDRPHLKAVYTSTTSIPQRVKEYDKELFVVFNYQNGRYEIHSKEAGETTYNCTLPYRLLDERTIRYIRKNDIKVHGMKIFDRIFGSEKKHEEQKEKDRKNFTLDFAREFQGEFAKDSWNM